MAFWPVIDLDEDGNDYDPNDPETRGCDPDARHENRWDD